MNLRITYLSSILIYFIIIGTLKSQELDSNLWVTNSTVYITKLSSTQDTLYLGGQFTYLGPRTGPGVVIDKNADTVDKGWPKFDGTVYNAISDGSGGWYVSGHFHHVGKFDRLGLVHIKADRNVDENFRPAMKSYAGAMVMNGTSLYVSAGQQLRVFNTMDGSDLPWKAMVRGTVNTLAISDSTVFLAGDFKEIYIDGNSTKTLTRNNIAAFDLSGKILTNWDANISGIVHSLGIKDNILYAGGNFTRVNRDSSRNNIAAFDIISSKATPWKADVFGGGIRTIAIHNSLIYVGGDFTHVNKSIRNRLAAIDINTGKETSWDPNIGGTINTLTISGEVVYVGGDFSRINNSNEHSNLAGFNITSGMPTYWNPKTNGNVNIIASGLNNSIFIGGTFVSAGGVRRNGMASINLRTGRATSFNPNMGPFKDLNVYDIAIKNNVVYAAGRFSKVNGNVDRTGLAAFNLDGKVTLWDPKVIIDNSAVIRLLFIGDTLYIGGGFQNVGKVPRHNLAAFNIITGELTSWDPNPDLAIQNLVAQDSLLFVTGYFTKVNGNIPRDGFAVFNKTNGKIASWNPNVNGKITAVGVEDSLLYLSGLFTIVNDSINCNGGVIFGKDKNKPSPWDRSVNIDAKYISQIFRDKRHIYILGNFSGSDYYPKTHLGAFRASDKARVVWGADFPNSPIYQFNVSSVQKRVYIAAHNIVMPDSSYTQFFGALTLPADTVEVDSTLDSLAPRVSPYTINCEGNIANVSVIDLPEGNAIRSNLSRIYLDASSYNYILKTAGLNPGYSSQATWSLTVKDHKKDAKAILKFMDNAGNDTSITVEYKYLPFTTELGKSQLDHIIVNTNSVNTLNLKVRNTSSTKAQYITGAYFPQSQTGFSLPTTLVTPDTLFPLQEKSYKIQFISKDLGYFEAQLTLEINSCHVLKAKMSASVGEGVGIDITQEQPFTITPNPASNIVTIHLPIINTTGATLEVIDEKGNSVLNLSREIQKGELFNISFNTAAFSRGLYIIQYRDTKNHVFLSRKLILN